MAGIHGAADRKPAVCESRTLGTPWTGIMPLYESAAVKLSGWRTDVTITAKASSVAASAKASSWTISRLIRTDLASQGERFGLEAKLRASMSCLIMGEPSE
jgi:hypothetical protein